MGAFGPSSSPAEVPGPLAEAEFAIWVVRGREVARVVEDRGLFLGQVEVGGEQVVIELLERPGSDNRGRYGRPRRPPGERHPRHRHTARLGDPLDGLDDSPGALATAPVPGLHAAAGI